MRRYDKHWNRLGEDGLPVPTPAGAGECRSCGCKDFRLVETRGRPGWVCRHCGRRVLRRGQGDGAARKAARGGPDWWVWRRYGTIAAAEVACAETIRHQPATD